MKIKTLGTIIFLTTQFFWFYVVALLLIFLRLGFNLNLSSDLSAILGGLAAVFTGIKKTFS